MFTIKLYSAEPSSLAPGYRQVIIEAECFTILRDDEGAEITVHYDDVLSERFDIRDPAAPRQEGWPPVYAKAIIENSAGKTTEIVGLPGPR